jgi:hypothetical protein
MNKTKQFLRSFLPKYIYFKKKNGSIAIIGSRRGGTTFLSSLLASSKTRIVDQPTEAFSREYKSNIVRVKRQVLPPKELYQYFNISQVDKICLTKYIQEIELGRYAILDLNFGLFKDRIVYKLIAGGFILDILSELNIKPLIIFRHPISQSLSCIRNNWGNIYKVYLDSSYFRETYLTEVQIKKMISIDKYGSAIEKGILDWYCSNIHVLRNWRNYPTVFYEDLVLNPEENFKMIESNFQVKVRRDKFNIASGSSFLSEDDFKNNIRNMEYKKSHIMKLLSALDDQDKEKYQELFNVLDIDIYTAFSVLPQK